MDKAQGFLDLLPQVEYLEHHLNGLGWYKIITCKDCKYYTGKWCTKYSTKQIDINDICKADDDFCSMAERKEHETD